MAAEAPTVQLPRAIDEWLEALEPASLAEIVGDPRTTALFSADMVVGFCDHGTLASPRIDALTPVVVDVFERVHALAVRDFVLLHDAHDPDALEFEAFPPHCIISTEESQTIPELQALPFADLFTVIEKNTLSPAPGTRLDPWLDAHAALRTAIVVGDCTDFCVYHAALHLRMRANAHRIAGFQVVVPANAVQTYHVDEGVEGAMAHDGDFFHAVFLYHMALSGVRVVRELA
jgi:nicotinamidase-related amidase